MSFKRSSYDMLVGELECSQQSGSEKCNFCGESATNPHKKDCPGNFICSLCGHMKTDHLDLKPCTSDKNMCLCPQCEHYFGGAPNSQHASSSAISQTPGFFTKGIGWLISFLSLLIILFGVFVGAIWLISDGGFLGLVLVIPILVGGIGIGWGRRIRKGFYQKFPVVRVILILLMLAGMGWGLTWMLTLIIISQCPIPGGC